MDEQHCLKTSCYAEILIHLYVLYVTIDAQGRSKNYAGGEFSSFMINSFVISGGTRIFFRGGALRGQKSSLEGQKLENLTKNGIFGHFLTLTGGGGKWGA